MNCFWIVSLKYWAQRPDCIARRRNRCELLLNCIFEILSTTVILRSETPGVLWIAFELYLWNIEHNIGRRAHHRWWVVNCFWIVSLKYWAQLSDFGLLFSFSCELLLNCIFEILSTTRPLFSGTSTLLWIAFELYLWNIEHNVS